MKTFIKTILFLGLTTAMNSAFAKTYKGYYQYKDEKGGILYQDLIALDVKAISETKFRYTYTEPTHPDHDKFICYVEIKELENRTRQLVQICNNEIDNLICQNDSCSGTTRWTEVSGQNVFPMAYFDGENLKSMTVNTLQPVKFRTIEGIRSFNMVLKAD